MAKMTHEEKQAAAQQKRDAQQAAARAAAIEKFRSGFLKEQSRRIYAERESWETGDAHVRALGSLVFDFKGVHERLVRELDRLVDAVAEAKAALAFGRDPMSWSNGLVGRYAEIDMLAQERKTLAKAIARTATACGMRVREIEDGLEREYADRMATYAVVESDSGGFLVRKRNSETELVYLNGERAVMVVAPDDATAYATADDAWAALHVIATGRSI